MEQSQRSTDVNALTCKRCESVVFDDAVSASLVNTCAEITQEARGLDATAGGPFVGACGGAPRLAQPLEHCPDLVHQRVS